MKRKLAKAGLVCSFLSPPRNDYANPFCLLYRRSAVNHASAHPTDLHPRARHPSARTPRPIWRPHPCVCLLFIQVYHYSNTSSSNLKYALELTNVVADSRYGVYEDFIADGSTRLEAFLKAVRLGVLRGLEEGGSDPFRTLRAGVDVAA